MEANSYFELSSNRDRLIRNVITENLLIETTEITCYPKLSVGNYQADEVYVVTNSNRDCVVVCTPDSIAILNQSPQTKRILNFYGTVVTDRSENEYIFRNTAANSTILQGNIFCMANKPILQLNDHKSKVKLISQNSVGNNLCIKSHFESSRISAILAKQVEQKLSFGSFINYEKHFPDKRISDVKFLPFNIKDNKKCVVILIKTGKLLFLTTPEPIFSLTLPISPLLIQEISLVKPARELYFKQNINSLQTLKQNRERMHYEKICFRNNKSLKIFILTSVSSIMTVNPILPCIYCPPEVALYASLKSHNSIEFSAWISGTKNGSIHVRQWGRIDFKGPKILDFFTFNGKIITIDISKSLKIYLLDNLVYTYQVWLPFVHNISFFSSENAVESNGLDKDQTIKKNSLNFGSVLKEAALNYSADNIEQKLCAQNSQLNNSSRIVKHSVRVTNNAHISNNAEIEYLLQIEMSGLTKIDVLNEWLVLVFSKGRSAKRIYFIGITYLNISTIYKDENRETSEIEALYKVDLHHKVNPSSIIIMNTNTISTTIGYATNGNFAIRLVDLNFSEKSNDRFLKSPTLAANIDKGAKSFYNVIGKLLSASISELMSGMKTCDRLHYPKWILETLSWIYFTNSKVSPLSLLQLCFLELQDRLLHQNCNYGKHVNSIKQLNDTVDSAYQHIRCYYEQHKSLRLQFDQIDIAKLNSYNTAQEMVKLCNSDENIKLYSEISQKHIIRKPSKSDVKIVNGNKLKTALSEVQLVLNFLNIEAGRLYNYHSGR